MPILIGGGGEGDPADRRRARPHLERLRRPGRAGRKSRILDDWCRKVGRDPKEIERSVNFRSSEIRNAERYVENGFTHLLLAFSGPYHDLGPLRELIAWHDGHRERNPETAVS